MTRQAKSDSGLRFSRVRTNANFSLSENRGKWGEAIIVVITRVSDEK
ncbi:MAG: hypothetical protein KDK33_09490 [Leptospiraceae bacterium]|nr:hypothetical protein [Leptospiraceae bacterium]